MTSVPTVYVVDDDEAVRQSLSRLLRSVSLEARTFASASEFLQESITPGPACLLLDVRLPLTSGFDLQQQLSLRGSSLPIIFLTGYGTIPMTVRAMKAGAVEFLTKPFAEEALLEAVHRALELDEATRDRRLEVADFQSRYQTLTERERKVMCLVTAGMLNKQAAFELGVAEITVKVHRRRVMEKMKAQSLADLVRIAERIGIPTGSPAG